MKKVIITGASALCLAILVLLTSTLYGNSQDTAISSPTASDTAETAATIMSSEDSEDSKDSKDLSVASYTAEPTVTPAATPKAAPATPKVTNKAASNATPKPVKKAASTPTATKKPTATPTPKATASSAPASPTASGAAAAVINTAKSYLNVPYVWGGTSPQGFDCSGFIQYVYSKHGISLPRVTADQYTAGTGISRSDLIPGDLVFFETYKAGASHVGIYLGNDQFIHASSGAGKVTISNLTSAYYTEHYVGARRVLK